MNDEIKNTEDKSNLIGVDPLARLSEEEKTSVLNENKETATTEESSVVENTEEASVEEGGNSYVIKLNDAVTIRNITELIEELNSIGSDKTELVFESEKIEKVDAAAIQLLSGFYLFSIEAGKKVVWDKPSEAFCSAVKLLGLNDIINLPSASSQANL